MKYKERFESVLGELPDPNDENEISIICPFHEDQKKSASINVRTRLFHCFACFQNHNFLTFKKAYQAEHGGIVPEDDTIVVKAIKDQTVRDLHFDLMTHQEIIDSLQVKRGISLESIKKWEVGWHERTKRVAIPIRDENGVCVNVRLYSFTQKGSQKMLSWKAGYGRARLWPVESLVHDKYVILCEGEMDRLVLSAHGLNAITSTGGAKTWKSEWSKQFVGLKVYIIYDNDLTGDEGARKAAANIAQYAEEVRVVRLDLSGDGEDITDFFVNYGYGVKDLKDLIKTTPIFKPPVSEDDYRNNEEIQWVTLGRSLMPQYRSGDLMIPVIVSARRDERMHFPHEIMFSCNQDAGAPCKKCAIFGIGEATVKIPREDPGLIDFVGVTQKDQSAIVRGRAGVPTNCRVVDIQTTESGTIEEILITPEIDSSSSLDQDSLHLVQRAFYIGVGLDYNASYVIKSRPIPFHKTSKIVHHVIDAVPAHDSIESFEMTEDVYARLEKFQSEPGRVKFKLAEIAGYLQDNVTRIWDRLDLHIGMDLVWHSALEFEFDQKVIRRGWLEAIVIGDTRTGKSEIATQLQSHYNFGEIVSGENTSYAGLVGGAIKYDDSWFVKWGRIPLNDRRMVVIDEVTGMSVDDIALMSGIRETGIADITKIESQRANARTRALWIGNVRPPKLDLSDYEFGCEALQDIIGMPEDIARFDYAISAAAEEVSSSVVNSDRVIDSTRTVYDADSCSLLVLWAWSRDRDSIQFQREALEACWKHAIEMGETYTSKVPLVMASNQRVKLARIGTAVAARTFSTDDGESLIVRAEHIDVARWLLDKFYSKPSFGYLQLSQQKDYLQDRRVESVGAAERFLRSRPGLADFLSRTKYVSVRKISDNTGVPDHEASDVIRKLGSMMMLEDRGTHGYFVTNDLKAIANRIRPEGFNMEDEDE